MQRLIAMAIVIVLTGSLRAGEFNKKINVGDPARRGKTCPAQTARRIRWPI